MPARARSNTKQSSAKGDARHADRPDLYPSPRLQPVYELVKKGVRYLRQGARCFAREASVSDAAGAVIAGTREERIQRRADACGFAAEGNGSNLMT